MEQIVRTANRPNSSKPLLRTIETEQLEPDTARRMAAHVDGIHSPISSQTTLKSRYEDAFRDNLLALNVHADYEPFRFLVGQFQGLELTYTPDFVTDIKFRDRRVILEPHAIRTHTFDEKTMELAKFRLFMEKFGKKFYMVMASDMSEVELALGFTLPLKLYMHEFWELPKASDPKTPSVVKWHLEELLAKARY